MRDDLLVATRGPKFRQQAIASSDVTKVGAREVPGEAPQVVPPATVSPSYGRQLYPLVQGESVTDDFADYTSKVGPDLNHASLAMAHLQRSDPERNRRPS